MEGKTSIQSIEFFETKNYILRTDLLSENNVTLKADKRNSIIIIEHQKIGFKKLKNSETIMTLKQ